MERIHTSRRKARLLRTEATREQFGWLRGGEYAARLDNLRRDTGSDLKFVSVSVGQVFVRVAICCILS
jgi:hypothetical protein